MRHAWRRPPPAGHAHGCRHCGWPVAGRDRAGGAARAPKSCVGRQLFVGLRGTRCKRQGREQQRASRRVPRLGLTTALTGHISCGDGWRRPCRRRRGGPCVASQNIQQCVPRFRPWLRLRLVRGRDELLRRDRGGHELHRHGLPLRASSRAPSSLCWQPAQLLRHARSRAPATRLSHRPRCSGARRTISPTTGTRRPSPPVAQAAETQAPYVLVRTPHPYHDLINSFFPRGCLMSLRDCDRRTLARRPPARAGSSVIPGFSFENARKMRENFPLIPSIFC